MRSRIPELRAARSLTQQQLADLAGVKQVTISKLENHPGAGDPATLSAVAEALGVRVDELTSDEPLRTLWVLRVLHELAHHLIATRHHTHADVWRLTLALAYPVHRVRAGLGPLEIPGWSLSLRAVVLTESRVISAA